MSETLHITEQDQFHNMCYVQDHYYSEMINIAKVTEEEAWYELVHLEPKYLIAVLGFLPEKHTDNIIKFGQKWLNQDYLLESVSPEKRRYYQACLNEARRLQQKGILHIQFNI